MHKYCVEKVEFFRLSLVLFKLPIIAREMVFPQPVTEILYSREKRLDTEKIMRI